METHNILNKILYILYMKDDYTLLRAPKQKPHHQMQFILISKTPFLRETSHSSAGDTVSVS